MWYLFLYLWISKTQNIIYVFHAILLWLKCYSYFIKMQLLFLTYQRMYSYITISTPNNYLEQWKDHSSKGFGESSYKHVRFFDHRLVNYYKIFFLMMAKNVITHVYGFLCSFTSAFLQKMQLYQIWCKSLILGCTV